LLKGKMPSPSPKGAKASPKESVGSTVCQQSLPALAPANTPPVLPAFEHDLVNAVNPPEGEPGANTMHHIGVTMTSILTKADLDRAQLH
jgi:hypothetical protein